VEQCVHWGNDKTREVSAPLQENTGKARHSNKESRCA
jgi:hypothetical protein